MAVGSTFELAWLIKNEHGVWRESAESVGSGETATVTGAAKPRVPWLKETLGTKDQKEAKVRAKPVMMKFDRVGGPSYAALRAFSEKLLVSGGAL